MVIKFSTDNAAFEENREEETVKILQRIIGRIKIGYASGYVMDSNGNKIGEWSIKALK